MGPSARKRICFVSTVPFALNHFMRAHIRALKADHDIVLVTNGSESDVAGLLDQGVSLITLPIERKVSVIRDVTAFWLLWRLFRREKFDIVHSITPKAGLLAMTAGRIAGIPIRLHSFTGQVWATRTGMRRRALRFFDRCTAANASAVLADSRSQREFLIDNRVVGSTDITVLADGSMAGVDTNRFRYDADARREVRAEIQFPADAIGCLFLGRLSRDKGIADLIHAFAIAAPKNARLHLLVVGPTEADFDGDFADLTTRFPLRVKRVGFSNNPERYMSASDILLLPSYREGFGTVIIEGAAVGLPAIASRICGITDAIDDGTTGILHDVGSVDQIADAILRLGSDKDLRHQMGDAARQRVIDKFTEARLTTEFVGYYKALEISDGDAD
jgi:glycosyltransferase involved in cell wall biosynthesis